MPTEPENPSRRDVHQISDARALRALSHPVRLALLEALAAGPLTATEAGELIDESPTTCSFHLRQLARYGFVEEAGGGRGRSRPWRLTKQGWRAPARPDDPDYTRASQALDRVLLDRYAQRLRSFVDAAPTYPREWYEAATGTQQIYHVTAAELSELTAAQRELAERYHARWDPRMTDPSVRPEGTLPVEVLFFAYPVAAPAPAEAAGVDDKGTNAAPTSERGAR
jgi:DNA-binding transcriptional ArsR family regulator